MIVDKETHQRMLTYVDRSGKRCLMPLGSGTQLPEGARYEVFDDRYYPDPFRKGGIPEVCRLFLSILKLSSVIFPQGP